MVFQFGDFQLDEECREIRLRGREIAVQPRVFDFLRVLMARSDRVVGKSELLDLLWPDVIVVDGALQRVVSLARSVLQQGGLRDAIRTYPRLGYRFCAEVTVGKGKNEHAQDDVPRALKLARAAFHELNWEGAIAAFLEADAEQPLAAADLERWSESLEWSGRGGEAIAILERAVAAHLSQSDQPGAARAAVLLAQIFFERLEVEVAKGWRNRAATWLKEKSDSREHGLLAYVSARIALMEGRFEDTLADAVRAQALGVALEDPDLEGLGLLYLGHAELALGAISQGLDHQSEAAAAVLAGEVSPWAGALIYCGVLWACRNRADWHRAAQWTERFSRWCEEKHMSAFPGTCVLHRAEVLGVQGKLVEAEQEIADSTPELAVRAPWAEGDAYRILGDLRLGRGDLEAAGQAYQRASELGWDPQPGQSMLLMLRGQPEAAARVLEAALVDSNWTNRERRGVLLAHLVLAQTMAGELERARTVAGELASCRDLCDEPGVQAVLLRGEAEIAQAEGRLEDAIRGLRAAISAWRQLGSPLNVAHLRLRLAEMLNQAKDRTSAELELDLAAATFVEHHAHVLVDRCAELRVSLS